MRTLRLANAAGRDATVLFAAVPTAPRPVIGIPGEKVTFRRYLASTEAGLHEALQARFGNDYGKALVEGDPEVDLEQVGRAIGSTDNVLLSAAGAVLFAAPRVVEVLLAPDGTEKERREPSDEPPNVTEESVLRWTPMRVRRAEAVRRFAFSRTLQIRHADGLTFDFLHALAKELHEADEIVYIGAGARGRDPLVFQANGTPYRAFLEGRVDGPRYQLLLHLSNLELKRPGGEA